VLRTPRRLRRESQALLLRQRVDGSRLPALLRPTNAISGNSCTGNWSSWLAVVRKRAVWVQASASLASAEGIHVAL
jgi:hypothetical protein